MKVYKVPVEVDNTNISFGYIFADNDYTDGGSHIMPIPGSYTFDNALQMMYAFDEILSSTLWRKAPQARYNRAAKQFPLEFLYPLIEQYWSGMTSFDALETVYSSDTVIDSNIEIAGILAPYQTLTTLPANGVFTQIGVGSPAYFGILGNSGIMSFNFVLIPEDAIINDKFSFSTDQYYAVMTFEIRGNNPFEIIAYVSGSAHIPQDWVTYYNGKPVQATDDDPYSGDEGTDDGSEPGGGGGGDDQDNWDPDSDPNPIPDLPSLSATDTGFITLYNPSPYELRQLSSYLWSGLFDIDQFRKIMADPMDAILGLSIVPVNVPTSGQQVVTVGNISTGISLNKASAQYVSLDCGSISISEKWHAYVDYSPYTKISIFLPYIGSHELNIDEIQGTTLKVVYHIDVLSGACVAFVTANNRVIYQFSGQCSVSIPITAHDFTNTLMALGQLAASGAAAGITTVASGGLSAPVSAAMVAGGITSAANTANNVIANKPRVTKSGNLSGSNGLLGTQKPYIIIERPKLCVPKNQNSYTGYPSYITYTLSELSGFTQVQDIKLNFSCTDSERNEIMQMLREGVIL